MICAGGGKPGINGWYAEGQAYAYLEGAIGIKVTVFRIKIEQEILRVGAGALLEAKLPNPQGFWMRGNVNGYYSLLGGRVKGRCDFGFELGEQCQWQAVDNPEETSMVDGLSVISALTPEQGKQAIDVFAAPQAVFNLPVDKPFTLSDTLKGQQQQFKLIIRRIPPARKGRSWVFATIHDQQTMITSMRRSIVFYICWISWLAGGHAYGQAAGWVMDDLAYALANPTNREQVMTAIRQFQTHTQVALSVTSAFAQDVYHIHNDQQRNEWLMQQELGITIFLTLDKSTKAFQKCQMQVSPAMEALLPTDDRRQKQSSLMEFYFRNSPVPTDAYTEGLLAGIAAMEKKILENREKEKSKFPDDVVAISHIDDEFAAGIDDDKLKIEYSIKKDQFDEFAIRIGNNKQQLIGLCQRGFFRIDNKFVYYFLDQKEVKWGGFFKNRNDWMHFEIDNRHRQF